VRKLRLAVAISAAVHAAAIAWIGTRSVSPRQVAEPLPVTQIEIVPVDRTAAAPPVEAIAPLEVAIVDDPPEPAPPPAAPQLPPAPTRPAAAIIAPGRAGDETAPERAGDATAAAPSAERSAMMAMRRGSRPELALPGGRWDALEHVPRGTTAEVDAATGLLSNAGGGTHRSDQGVFVAKVEADGTVKITDRPNFHIHLVLPSPKDVGHGLARWYTTDRGTYGEPLAPGSADVGKAIQVTPGATTDQADRRSGNAGDRTPTVLVPVFGGGFDVNDWLMRGRVGDPYASRKLAMLDATRDERVQIGNRHRADQLKQSTQIMRRNLDALWAATPDPAARKQALFEMWDECAEAGDPALVEAGEAARRLVIGFIRARIPAGSPGAFTAAELAALARGKQSKAAFAPYAAAP